MRQPRQLLGPAPERALRRLFAAERVASTLVVTSGRAGHRDAGARITGSLDGAVRFHVTAAGVDDVAAIEALVADLADDAPDAVISVGGGAVHDRVKAAFAASAAGDLPAAASHFEPPSTWTFPRLTIRRPLFVTAPTTFTGSEANGHAGFRSAGHKRIVSHEALVPDAVAIDPELLRLSPSWLLVESLFNAMNHAIEAVASPRQGVLTQAAALGGAAVIGGALRGDPDTWTDRELGSLGAASALITAGQSGTTLGLAHAIAHVLGAHFSVRHSRAHAIVAAPAVRFNGANADFADLARAFGAEPRGDTDAAGALADALVQAARRHHLAVGLAEAGLTAGDIPAIATAVQAEPGFHFNARPIADIADLHDLLEGML